MEDLGIIARPVDAEYPELPKGGWKKVYQAAETLGSILGGSDVRERLAVSYMRPSGIGLRRCRRQFLMIFHGYCANPL